VNSPADFRRAAKDPTHRASILRNPLSWETKIQFLAEIYKDRLHSITIADDDSLRTTDMVFDWLKNQGYTELVWCAGDDRIEQYEQMIAAYQRTHEPFESFTTLSAGERDPDSELDANDASSISGTKLRQAVVDNDFRLFASAIDSDDEPLVRGLFDAVKQGLALPEVHMEGIVDSSHLDPLTEGDLALAVGIVNKYAADSYDKGSLVNQVAKLLRQTSQFGVTGVVQQIAKALGVPPDLVKPAVFQALTPKHV
jgi:hypothetical protein